MMRIRSNLVQILFIVLVLAAGFLFWQRTAAPYPGGEWVLVEIGGRPPLEGTQISIQLTEGAFSGFGGCNHYGGLVAFLPNGRLTVEGIESSAQACLDPAGVMEQEAEYFTRLQQSSSFEESADRLALWDPENRVQLVFVPRVQYTASPEQLSASAWVWKAAGSEILVASPPVEMRFEAGRILGFAGCRYFAGETVVSQDRLHVTALRMFDAGCTDPASRAVESRFLDAIDLFERYYFNGQELVIELANGNHQTFAPGEAVDGAAPEELANAGQALERFFDLLAGEDFQAAAALYGGPAESFETLAYLNPTIDPADTAALLDAYCSLQVPCLRIGEILRADFLPGGAVLLAVTFVLADGSPFILGPCCGEEGPVPETPTEYEYIFLETGEGYKVFGNLVYVP